MDILKLATQSESVMSLWRTYSPLVMYIDDHNIFFFFINCLKCNCPDSFRIDAELKLPCRMKKKYTSGIILLDENVKKKVKLSVHNQWRVLHNDFTDCGGVANLRMSIIRIN